MAKAEVTKKPSGAVSNLAAPVRTSGHKMKATWKVPNDLIKDSSHSRATSLVITWSLGIPGKDPKYVDKEKNERETSSEVNLNSFKVGSKTYTRDSFHPVKSGTYLSYVKVKVVPKNKKGEGKSVSKTRNFEVPRKPVISDLAFNNSNGVVSGTIDTNAGDDYKERYDTVYSVTVQNPFANGGKAYNYVNGQSSRSTSIPISYDAQQYMNLSYTQYIRVTVNAYARGYAGNSPAATAKTLYVSYPAKATISDVYFDELSPTGKLTVKLKTNTTTTHPVDKVKLQYAADVEYDNASDIPANEWQDTQIEDNGYCTALSMPVSDLLPSRGHHSWVRVVTYHLNENVLFRYSEPKMVAKLEKASTPPADIDIKILECYAGANGKSAVVHLGWNKDGRDDFTGTELSWSDSPDTWKSTEEPKSFRFTWSDGMETFDGVTYGDSATLTIRGLNEGQVYYIKARRYLEADPELYSQYAETDPIMTSDTPDSIVANSASFIAEGEPLSVYWTFSGNGVQTKWQVVNVNTDSPIVEGEGSTGSIQIDSERLKSVAVNNVVTYRVEISTGGKPVVSEVHTVTIIQAPTLSISAPATMTAQPYSFTATSNTQCSLIVIITAQGITGQMPDGIMNQIAGDTVYSNVYSDLNWVESSGTYTATVTMPTELDFHDTGRYNLSVVAIDNLTQLRAPEANASFLVDWTNKAVDIEGAVTLTPIYTVDEEGDHRRAVQIDLTPPTGCSQSDVYDIYRMDIEKPNLIGLGFPLTHTVVDEYAPFGDETPLSYRFALRTVDGDVSYDDVEYEASCENMRFDWAEGSLELPYGLSIGDSFKKDSDIRQHMDGSSDGYWNQNIERKSSLNSSIIKILQPQDIERARSLARYAGPVFVRLPNGSAFEADVQVTDLSVKNKAVTAIAIDATEIGLTNEFMLPTPYELVEEEEQS